MRIALTLVMVLILTLPLAGWWYAQRPLPVLDGLVSIPALRDSVMVKFDGRAVPYVEAGSEQDMYLAQGFLTARDRIFQMDMLRRAAQGKLSEIYGPGCLAQDKLMRTIGCGRLAATEVNKLSPEVRGCLQEYCRGVNLYLSDNLDKLPLEFTVLGYKPQPWTPADSMSVLKYMSYLRDESWRLDDMRQRIADKLGRDKAAVIFRESASTGAQSGNARNAPKADVPVKKTDTRTAPKKAPPAPDPNLSESLGNELFRLGKNGHGFFNPKATWGSTAWVVSANNSDSGGALLASDKDEALTFPDLWYLTSLSAPAFHAAGATIPGVPGVLAGRNDYIIWSSASLKADVQDLVIEEFSPRFLSKYKTTSGWETAAEITEEIPVRFGPNVVHKVLSTAHGPVLVKNGTKAVALAWTGTTVDKPALETIHQLNRAHDWREFVEALRQYPGPSLMFVYADHAGNIGYQAAGDLPVRSGGADGTTLVTGWETKGQWTGRVPFDELLSNCNPPAGYLIAANQKLVKPGSQALIGHQWCAPYRDLRLESYFFDILAHGRKIGLPDSNELLSDQAGYLSPLVKKEVSQALSGAQEIDKFQLVALDLLEHWDGTVKAESAAAAIYESFLQTLVRRLLTPKLGKELTQEYLDRWPAWPLFVERYLKEKPLDWLPPEERTYPTFILTTFSSAVNTVRLALRSDDPKHWVWQAAHKATFKHVLSAGLPWLSFVFDAGPVGVGGEADVVNALDIAGDTTTGQFACRNGPTMRLLVDGADRAKFYQSLSLGQSGQIFSPTARDQLQAWLRVDPLPVAFSPEQLDRQTQHKLVLTNKSLGRSE